MKPKPHLNESGLYDYAIKALGRHMRTEAELRRLMLSASSKASAATRSSTPPSPDSRKTATLTTPPMRKSTHAFASKTKNSVDAASASTSPQKGVSKQIDYRRCRSPVRRHQ